MKWLSDTHATEDAATQLASLLSAPMVLALYGDLGVGKTTFVRALLRAWGWQAAVKSPTFALVETYELSSRSFVLHHFDLYRMTSHEELAWIGWRDYFTADAVCCIEWPERAEAALGNVDLSLSLQIEAEGRWLVPNAGTARGEQVLRQWMN